ncbi:hypothetical protein PF005_g23598 [Phytophthora fragariae]|uniref:FYVE-type domain-containing protein n=1 Tax=Phytophthora fragariae TaxID=53985 RepID=A0A6A3W5V1_9STRA|nr:hypothetical protein PF003_g5961 [Phytophthora fragariae]KAE8925447.1 hypothetical protein PF009_g24344 [Phytophthora fragariae]KAE8980478.1 hypothetical protein PF011_g22425 [Phytophthora fragariae]KAE9078928.1 hypothetical protein PF010_g22946 [Phytophthora fragariae]KAE9079027.1 hypothetical protein PF007_g23612 [Phytophthora fragariae]
MRARSVRLRLDRPVDSHLERSRTSSSTTESVTSSWTDGEPPAPPLTLSISLRDLVAEAEALHDRLDFATFVDLAESPRLPHYHDGQSQWKRVEKSSTFTLLKRDDEVLALARLDASVEEVANILTATTDPLHAAAMKGLYGDAFIAGSVAYVQRPHAYEHDQVHQHLAVKTTSFVRSDILGKNEQWCFAENFRCKPQGDSFTLTQGSLSESQARSLPARSALKDSARRVAQVHDVTAAYLVERMPGNHGIRVVFHATYKRGEENDAEGEAPAVVRKAVRARLLRLARGVAQLSQLVHRRRFGAQVYADCSAFDVKNPRCTCCTRKLSFLVFMPRTRCYLCGYYVCVTCSSSEKMETHNGRLASIIVCTRCRLSVTACNYTQMLTVLPGPERALPDPSPIAAQSVLSKGLSSSSLSSRTSDLSSTFSTVSSDSSSSSQMLAELLGQVVDSDSDEISSGRRQAAIMVLNQLLTADQEEAQVQADENKKLLGAALASSPTTEVAHKALDVSAYPEDPAECKFASAESRPYPMVPVVIPSEMDSSDPPEPITYPIPANEDVRLGAIEHFKLHEILNVPELNVICSLAAAEMGCPHSVITLVECEVVTLLATNAPENWDVGSGNPREQTFCQHFVMDDQPLLVRHAEADMRFYHIAPVTMRSLRFYAGFPVSVSSVLKAGKPGEPDKVVVGALCCLDAKPHQMMRSQYWRLMKLADAASKILERSAKEYIADPKKYARGQNEVGDQASTKKNATAAVAC